MNKLFYEVKNDFKPEYFMVMMGHARKGGWQPVNFSEESGSFGLSDLVYEPLMDDGPVEIYDRETIMRLMAHHALNSGGCSGCEIRLVPVFVPPTLKGNSDCPYINLNAPLDGIIQSIKESAAYCRDIDPDTWEESWNLPKSLGGSEVVPADPIKRNMSHTVTSEK